MLFDLRTIHLATGSALLLGTAAIAGCAGVLGFSDYALEDARLDANIEVSTEAAVIDGGDAASSCNVDLTVQCYPCPSANTEQFLNACTDGECIPFDKSRLAELLTADGGLPSLPPRDGGT